MANHYKFWKVYFLTCDGGINPGHHHAVHIQVHENQDGTCEIWRGSAHGKEIYPDYNAAVENLKEKYDYVTYDGHNLVMNYKPSEPIRIK